MNYQLLTTGNWQTVTFTLCPLRSSHLYNCRGFTTNSPYLKKRTQFQKSQIEHKPSYNNELRQMDTRSPRTKRTQTNPISPPPKQPILPILPYDQMNTRKAFTFTQPDKTLKSGLIVFFSLLSCLPLIQEKLLWNLTNSTL
jgi:hypothetical protein